MNYQLKINIVFEEQNYVTYNVVQYKTSQEGRLINIYIYTYKPDWCERDEKMDKSQDCA